MFCWHSQCRSNSLPRRHRATEKRKIGSSSPYRRRTPLTRHSTRGAVCSCRAAVRRPAWLAFRRGSCREQASFRVLYQASWPPLHTPCLVRYSPLVAPLSLLEDLPQGLPEDAREELLKAVREDRLERRAFRVLGQSWERRAFLLSGSVWRVLGLSGCGWGLGGRTEGSVCVTV